MSTIVLTVTDESLTTQIRQVCRMLRGVTSVKVVKDKPEVKDIAKTQGTLSQRLRGIAVAPNGFDYKQELANRDSL